MKRLLILTGILAALIGIAVILPALAHYGHPSPMAKKALFNPLNAGVTNGANPMTTTTNVTFVGEAVPAPGTTNILLDGVVILQWSGSNYIQTGFDSGFGGWVGSDGQDAEPGSPPTE